MLLLDARMGDCTMLSRAKSAADTGATGALVILPDGVAGANMTAALDPRRDDLYSIRSTNIPVGTVSLATGARPCPRGTLDGAPHGSAWGDGGGRVCVWQAWR